MLETVAYTRYYGSTGSHDGPTGSHPECARVLQAYLPAADFAATAVGGILAGCFAGYSYHPILPALVASGATCMYLSVNRNYDLQNLSRPFFQSQLLISASILWLATGFATSAGLPPRERPPFEDFALAAFVGLTVLAALRLGAGLLLQAWRRAGKFQHNIAIVGLNDVSKDLIERLQADRLASVRIAGLYQAPGDTSRVTHGGLIVTGAPGDLVEHCAMGMFDLIIMALPHGVENVDGNLDRLVSLTGCDVGIVSQRELAAAHKIRLDHFGDGFAVAVAAYDPPADRSVHKIVFDRSVALVLLVLLLPVFLFIGVAIRLDSKGPVFFRQPRCGYRNRTFHILKFRTLYHKFRDLRADQQTIRNDSRVTRVGRWLRRTSLDELPQLLNVVKGEMSLVGPRPHATGTRAGHRHLREIVDTYLLRHKVKPGITGLAQINGCRGAIRSDDQVVERVAYDMFYIENWSFLLDLKILIMTIF
jgi:exopolysaccharide biosynthesis polyprenyl glycosylphosphotransferase